MYEKKLHHKTPKTPCLSPFFSSDGLWNGIAKGSDFSGKFGSDETVWYPASGHREYNGSLGYVRSYGYCWSYSPSESNGSNAYNLNFGSGTAYPSNDNNRSRGLSVRCQKE